ncbi:SRPBCC domain-containing protein [Pedobacter foliorum]|uniref:SRPBCC family protein n=1 Tax=Pedobacter foliorum TaxID=2739058 RepID=UPI0015660DE7|nr:SRPBCC domain-containing protein [Pedobacter foliorum]NRF41159.1 SRPBCC domain-containing protein [Pedobacter foliorum]
MKTEPIVIERILNASINSVWQALTDNQKMKQWYFDIEEFEPEVGFEFKFYGGSEEKKYLHICKVTEVVPYHKLIYSWHYDSQPGMSYVTFELSEEGEKTRLKLTHEGLESFPADRDSAFAKDNFTEGWNMIIGTLLKEYLEKE